MKRVASLIALVVLVAACSHDTKPTTVHLADPGRCTPVDVAAAPEIEPTLESIAHDFNASESSRLADGHCAFVRVHTTESAAAASQLQDGWVDTEELGPHPRCGPRRRARGSRSANQRLAAGPERRSRAGRPHGPHVTRDRHARADGGCAREAGRTSVGATSRVAPTRGWAAYGHPEWGAFRLGKANPARATTGLLETIAVARLGDTQAERALEGSVIYYGDTAGAFLDNWHRLDKRHQSLAYVSAVVADERSVRTTKEPERLPPGRWLGSEGPSCGAAGCDPANDGALDSDNRSPP